jgi:hypothetical protein
MFTIYQLVQDFATIHSMVQLIVKLSLVIVRECLKNDGWLMISLGIVLTNILVNIAIHERQIPIS